ncbi:uncharacterized protein LOC132200407 [Neocloeon triangulifer]|uniref:uncharacterized protein LOC132200407 n=1 Tax=Neocloeon triangulifer TaxID=2078957 RepID=UPI00286FAB8F|nr:uncharacterized protein LOC132200407 [Neocloeon triangulifer]
MLRGAQCPVARAFFRPYSSKSAAASSAFPKIREDNFDHVVRSPYNVEVSDLNLSDFVWRNIRSYPEQPALTCGLTGRTYKYKEARGSSFNLSVALLNVVGLRPGDVLGMLMPNVPEFPLVFLGAASAGLVVTPANPLYTPEELARQFTDANVRCIVTVASLFDKVQETVELMPGGAGPIIVEGVPIYKDLLSLKALMMRQLTRMDLKPERIDPDALVALPYSSGTTGVPKGVMLTHRNMVASINQMDHPQMIAYGQDGPQERGLSVIPFFHIYGLQGTLNMSLSRGYHVITLPKFEPQSFSNAVRNYKPTMMALVPPLVKFMTQSPTVNAEDLQFLRLVTSGAAPLGKPHVEAFLRKINNPEFIFKEAYGLTETSCMATMMPNAYIPEKIGSCGLPAPLVEVKVIDKNGISLPVGETGELLMRGPNVMKGYLNNEKATRRILSEDGWLMTGDLAYIDSDGFVFIVDRMKELIKVKGLQVSPTELEEILIKMDGIADVAVVGVPDEIAGELPKAYVVKKPGSNITEDEVCTFLEPHVANFKHLKGGVQFVNEIPKNAAGKVLRKNLKDL